MKNNGQKRKDDPSPEQRRASLREAAERPESSTAMSATVKDSEATDEPRFDIVSDPDATKGIVAGPCKMCGGEGKKTVVVIHKFTGLKKLAIEWCLCTKSKIVSGAPSTKLLVGLGDSYLDPGEVDQQLYFVWPPSPDNSLLSPNLLIANMRFESFCYHVKGFVMRYRFMDPAPMIYACTAIDVLKDFYVAQNDGSSRSLSDLNQYDLVVIALGTQEKNDQLKTCLAQVVHSRVAMHKPTWIYLPYPTLETCKQDYSEELKEQLMSDAFKKVTLKEKNRDGKAVSKANMDASQFSGAGRVA